MKKIILTHHHEVGGSYITWDDYLTKNQVNFIKKMLWDDDDMQIKECIYIPEHE